jgi:hypothetical protein
VTHALGSRSTCTALHCLLCCAVLYWVDSQVPAKLVLVYFSRFAVHCTVWHLCTYGRQKCNARCGLLLSPVVARSCWYDAICKYRSCAVLSLYEKPACAIMHDARTPMNAARLSSQYRVAFVVTCMVGFLTVVHTPPCCWGALPAATQCHTSQQQHAAAR